MGGITEIVDSLESKLVKLAHKLDGLQRAKGELEHEVSRSATLINRQADEIELLKKQNESLKMANSLLAVTTTREKRNSK